MRFYRKLGWIRVATWVGFGLVLSLGQLKQGRPLWLDLLAFFVCVLLFLSSYLFWYWEIQPERLIHRRYLTRVVFPYTEITYIGPVTGRATEHATAKTWILVRTESGQKMIVDAADPPGFLDAIRKYLPRITLNL
jgi:hypothetical protein